MLYRKKSLILVILLILCFTTIFYNQDIDGIISIMIGKLDLLQKSLLKIQSTSDIDTYYNEVKQNLESLLETREQYSSYKNEISNRIVWHVKNRTEMGRNYIIIFKKITLEITRITYKVRNNQKILNLIYKYYQANSNFSN